MRILSTLVALRIALSAWRSGMQWRDAWAYARMMVNKWLAARRHVA
jgi:hypothetical protein